MGDRRELRQGRTAHALGGRIASDEVRMLPFKGDQLVKEAVVLRIPDLRRIKHMVEMVVPADQPTQLVQPGLDFIGHGLAWRRPGRRLQGRWTGGQRQHSRTVTPAVSRPAGVAASQSSPPGRGTAPRSSP